MNRNTTSAVWAAALAALALGVTTEARASQAVDGSARIAGGVSEAAVGSVQLGHAAGRVIIGATALPLSASGALLSDVGAGSTALADGLWDAATTELVIDPHVHVGRPAPAPSAMLDGDREDAP